MIFGHFIDFGHFPIEAKKEVPTWEGEVVSKNKNISETSESSGKTWEHAKFNILNFLK